MSVRVCPAWGTASSVVAVFLSIKLLFSHVCSNAVRASAGLAGKFGLGHPIAATDNRLLAADACNILARFDSSHDLCSEASL